MEQLPPVGSGSVGGGNDGQGAISGMGADVGLGNFQAPSVVGEGSYQAWKMLRDLYKEQLELKQREVVRYLCEGNETDRAKIVAGGVAELGRVLLLRRSLSDGKGNG